MKKLFPLFLLIFGTFISAQNVKFETLLTDKISIRALEISEGKVWYSGTDSKFGYVDLKNLQNQKQIKLSEKKLQFRTLAQDKNSFYTINIESPAQFFKIDKKSLKFNVVYQDTAKTAFYDALYFNKNKFYAFSDPSGDLNLKLLQFNLNKGKFEIKNYSHLKMNVGEAAFAASNTNISGGLNYIWIGTGGNSSRILRLNLKNDKLEAFDTPFVQGISSQGIYSIDFSDDKFGIAVGGDYTKQEANINNIATTNDGGETWQIQASGKNAGYTTCVKIKPGSKGKEIISVGDQHISYSSDFGKTWKKISDEKALFVCEWIDKNTVVFAGKDRIIKMKLD
ncbi:WD40/YVTN/BNR-like repeat-containing protein [Chryseobacterium chendengshani]|uniref:WD40/YVTN/BNR-like repeat-containing protein n=1 Tax=Chryseobacterium sp. LJ756 TaxID=2864113 RepID=UPI001C641D46|nr:glycosyl hydrolase [Chryseobacterium sp. LJ756]MBW7674084.1 glycosyl hydrolase [Chryseobacterium sp. LJ756]